MIFIHCAFNSRQLDSIDLFLSFSWRTFYEIASLDATKASLIVQLSYKAVKFCTLFKVDWVKASLLSQSRAVQKQKHLMSSEVFPSTLFSRNETLRPHCWRKLMIECFLGWWKGSVEALLSVFLWKEIKICKRTDKRICCFKYLFEVFFFYSHLELLKLGGLGSSNSWLNTL